MADLAPLNISDRAIIAFESVDLPYGLNPKVSGNLEAAAYLIVAEELAALSEDLIDETSVNRLWRRLYQRASELEVIGTELLNAPVLSGE